MGIKMGLDKMKVKKIASKMSFNDGAFTIGDCTVKSDEAGCGLNLEKMVWALPGWILVLFLIGTMGYEGFLPGACTYLFSMGISLMGTAIIIGRCVNKYFEKTTPLQLYAYLFFLLVLTASIKGGFNYHTWLNLHTWAVYFYIFIVFASIKEEGIGNTLQLVFIAGVGLALFGLYRSIYSGSAYDGNIVIVSALSLSIMPILYLQAKGRVEKALYVSGSVLLLLYTGLAWPGKVFIFSIAMVCFIYMVFYSKNMVLKVVTLLLIYSLYLPLRGVPLSILLSDISWIDLGAISHWGYLWGSHPSVLFNDVANISNESILTSVRPLHYFLGYSSGDGPVLARSFFIEIFIITGVVGTIAFLVFISMGVHNLTKAEPIPKYSLLSSLLILLLSILRLSGGSINPVTVLFWCFFGILFNDNTIRGYDYAKGKKWAILMIICVLGCALVFNALTIKIMTSHYHIHRGLSFEEEGFDHMALGQYRKAGWANSGNPLIYYLLGRTYLKMGMPGESLSLLDKYFMLGGNSAQAYATVAKAYHKMGRAPGAVDILQGGMEVHPYDPILASLMEEISLINERETCSGFSGRIERIVYDNDRFELYFNLENTTSEVLPVKGSFHIHNSMGNMVGTGVLHGGHICSGERITIKGVWEGSLVGGVYTVNVGIDGMEEIVKSYFMP